MNTLRVALAILIIGLAGTSLQAQGAPPDCLTQAYLGRGPIYAGRIIDAHGEPPDSVTVAIDSYLRGVHAASDKVALHVDYQGGEWQFRPPVWLNVKPQIGKRLLVILPPTVGAERALCVIDLDSDPQWVAQIQRMTDLDTGTVEERKQKLSRALQDPSPTVQSFAKYRLRTHFRPPDTERETAFSAAATVAQTGNSQQKIQAIATLTSGVYDDSKSDSEVNAHVLYLLAQLAQDSDPAVRGEAIKALNAKLFARGQAQFLLQQINIKNRDALVTQLKGDIEQKRSYSEQAGQLLCALNPKADSACTARGYKDQLPQEMRPQERKN